MIERSYPGVYLSEVAFSAKPIDGVSTDRTDATGIDRVGAEPPVEAPTWTDANASDPGITIAELLDWVSEFALYGGPAQIHDPLEHVAVEAGLAGGLAGDPPR